MSETGNIFSFDDGKGKKLSDEKLQAYLSGQLSPEEQREVELLLAEEGMESDAVEGLQHLGTEDAKQSVNNINRQLRFQLSKKKRRRKQYSGDTKWGVVAILVVLLLCILGFVVLRLLIH